jgi:hypothetical protein
LNLLLWLGVALVVIWLAAWMVLKIAGLTVHLILIAAVALIIWALVKGTVRKVKGPGAP